MAVHDLKFTYSDILEIVDNSNDKPRTISLFLKKLGPKYWHYFLKQDTIDAFDTYVIDRHYESVDRGTMYRICELCPVDILYHILDKKYIKLDPACDTDIFLRLSAKLLARILPSNLDYMSMRALYSRNKHVNPENTRDFVWEMRDHLINFPEILELVLKDGYGDIFGLSNTNIEK
jgi:hypothetical protein